jgi:23S rRNA G2069 N7-methylase RlmK/C1962 C5-methylase RlmI
VLDPPSYGHGPGGGWRLEDDLPDLVRAVGRLVAGAAAFVLVTAHARDLEPDALADVVAAALPNRGSFQSGRLALTSETGAVLPAGVYVQWRGDAS